MKSIEFKTLQGSKFTGVVQKNERNTYLVIHGSEFFGTPTGLRAYSPKSFNETMGIPLSTDINIELSVEEKDKVFSAMWPEKKVVEVIAEWEQVECVISGEVFVKYQKVRMLNGDVKTIEKLRIEI